MSDEVFNMPDAPEGFTPEKKSKKTLWIILAVVAAVIPVLLCGCRGRRHHCRVQRLF